MQSASEVRIYFRFIIGIVFEISGAGRIKIFIGPILAAAFYDPGYFLRSKPPTAMWSFKYVTRAIYGYRIYTAQCDVMPLIGRFRLD